MMDFSWQSTTPEYEDGTKRKTFSPASYLITKINHLEGGNYALNFAIGEG